MGKPDEADEDQSPPNGLGAHDALLHAFSISVSIHCAILMPARNAARLALRQTATFMFLMLTSLRSSCLTRVAMCLSWTRGVGAVK